MNDSKFIIDIIDLYWIDGEKDNPEDLCLHGEVNVKIGDEIVADNYSCTVSSTALYLLKSTKVDHIIARESNQMFPCCGHFIAPSEEEDIVEIYGCPDGIDLSVLHIDGFIKLITEKGNDVTIHKDSYNKTVFNFVDKIEDFYKNSTKKKIPNDDFDRDGYMKFWKEWHNLRAQGKS